jgi:hypothetical protein
MGTNFYPRVRVRVRISTRSLFVDGRVIALPDPNPTCCHPYCLFGPTAVREVEEKEERDKKKKRKEKKRKERKKENFGKISKLENFQ